MITELTLQNWKSFKNTKLFIDPITVLIGTNASGKSNIFDALKFLGSLTVPMDIMDTAKKVRGGIEGIIRCGEKDCTLSVTMESDKNTQELRYQITISYDSQNNIFIKGESLISISSKKPLVLFERKDIDEHNSSLVSVALYSEGKARYLNFPAKSPIISQIEYVDCRKRVKDAANIVIGNFKRIKLSNPIPERMRDFEHMSNSISDDASDMAGYLANLDADTQESTYESILKYLKPLPDKDIKSIRAEKISNVQDYAMLFCTEEWIPGKFQKQSAKGMSDGTLRFAGIITMLVTAEDHSLILLEELDKGVHPSRAKNLVRMLREVGKQKELDIICTTHNATFIDELGPQMIPFISYVKRDRNNGCSDIRLLEDNNQLARLMAMQTVGGMMINNEL